MRRPSPSRACCVFAVALALVAVVPASTAVSAVTAWIRPVAGAVVEPFRAPSGQYAGGHRGVDLAAPPGTPARASGAGTVAFAGEIDGAWHVTLTHAGGLRTSYSYLADVTVREGDVLDAGDVVGHTGGVGPGHYGSVLHFGLRVGDRYVDPTVLFRPADLTRAIRLAPATPPPEQAWTAASERRDLVSSLGLTAASEAHGCGDGIPLLGSAIDAVCDVAGWLGDRAGDAVDAGVEYLHAVTALGDAALAGVRAAARAAVDEMRRLSAAAASALARTVAGRTALDLVAIGRRFWNAVSAKCADDDPPADGTGGSGHRVMVVAGINSSGAAGDRGPTVDLDVAALGYHADDGEVRYFSYAADGGPYTRRDTYGPIEVAARRLRDQLRVMQREQPGREVDLLGHSQGGVVIDYFLEHVYRPGDPTLPPLGTVVTLSSPHAGAPLATAGGQLRGNPVTGALLDQVGAHSSIPPAGTPAVRELSETSRLVRHLWDQGLPEHFDFTTIGATEDLVVPATQIGVPGADETVVAGHGLSQHHGIVTAPDALRAVRAALEGRPLPCVGLGTALRSAVVPVLVTRLQHDVGAIGSGLPALVPTPGP